MKLLILTCLMAAALAMPKLHHRNAVNIQNQYQDSSEEQQESVKLPMYLKFTEQRAILTEQSDEIKEQAMASAQQAVASTSSSSEETVNAVSNVNEQAALAQRQPMSVVDQVFPQFYQQYETYPFWPFIPQDVQHITPESVLNTAKPIAPKTAGETKAWW
ncbi:alpha-S1-casein [Microtus oregoni]|uniref:alpha-S1-casein n=1 Tax=Microtus oregoni TaxID=111838 RepID=UPI001BB182AB|nr:alpha-S1-casein [Microtus oregoni]